MLYHAGPNPRRGPGRTTALMLRVLADACLYPGCRFRFYHREPPCVKKQERIDIMYDTLRSMAEALGLQCHLRMDHGLGFIEIQAAHIRCDEDEDATRPCEQCGGVVKCDIDKVGVQAYCTGLCSMRGPVRDDAEHALKAFHFMANAEGTANHG